MLHVLYEGTPIVEVPASAGNFEAGNVAMLTEEDGKAVLTLSDGSSAFGIFADRRGSSSGLSNIAPLPVDRDDSGNRLIGDESLFNQPGIMNDLPLIPPGTIRTTTLLPDETAPSGKVTVYIRGGVYETDQYVSTDTFTVGASVFSDASGKLTVDDNGGASVEVGVVITPPSTYYGLLKFKLTLV